MINELTKAVIEKHGPIRLVITKDGKFGIYRMEDQFTKAFWSFSLISCLIKMLAEEKIDNTTPCYICESKPCVCKGDKI